MPTPNNRTTNIPGTDIGVPQWELTEEQAAIIDAALEFMFKLFHYTPSVIEKDTLGAYVVLRSPDRFYGFVNLG